MNLAPKGVMNTNKRFNLNSINKIKIIDFVYVSSADINNNIVDSYLKLIERLTTNNKLELIAKLSLSIKSDARKNKKQFKKSFGALQTKESAEEMIVNLRNDRLLTRQIESF